MFIYTTTQKRRLTFHRGNRFRNGTYTQGCIQPLITGGGDLLAQIRGCRA